MKLMKATTVHAAISSPEHAFAAAHEMLPDFADGLKAAVATPKCDVWCTPDSGHNPDMA